MNPPKISLLRSLVSAGLRFQIAPMYFPIQTTGWTAEGGSLSRRSHATAANRIIKTSMNTPSSQGVNF